MDDHAVVLGMPVANSRVMLGLSFGLPSVLGWQDEALLRWSLIRFFFAFRITILTSSQSAIISRTSLVYFHDDAVAQVQLH